MKRYGFWAAVLLVAAMILVLNTAAFAHGHTEVGQYELVIGFSGEPAYQGEPNGLDLFVTNTETGEPVNGLEETLQVEIIYGSSTKALEIRTQFGQDGAYTAHVLPTDAGDYTWRIWGTIEDTAVDVSMTSSPDTFGSVEAKSAVSFPSNEPAATDLVAATEAASQSARTATMVGIAGIVLGLVGVVIGFLGWRGGRLGQASGYEAQQATR